MHACNCPLFSPCYRIPGPLQVLVLLDAVTSLVMSVPLLYLVNVWQHFRSSYKLSAIVLLFTVRALPSA